MRVLSKVALGGTVASVATGTWLVAAGVFATSATLVVADPVAPPAKAAAGLTSFDSCASLLDWYVERGVTDVGPYGWDSIFLSGAYSGLDVRRSALSGFGDVGTKALAPLSQTSSATGTNTQEEAVDESDVAKTNGSLVARIVDDSRLVLIDVAHGEPTVTKRVQLPRNGGSSELLLLGDRVLIAQQAYVQVRPTRDLGGNLASRTGRPGTRTRLIDVDVSDPKAPRVLSRTEYSGQLLAMRQYGDTVRLVTSTGRPELRWTYPRRGVSRHDAVLANRALVRKTTIADWVPTVGAGRNAKPLVGCDQVEHPDTWSGAGTVAVTAFDIGAPTQRSSVAVTADSQVVYSSADRLYLAAAETATSTAGDLPRPSRPGTPRTNLYAFGLDGLTTPYLGTGSVLGQVRDRWSLDEHDGKLRVAWTRYGRRGGSQSGISVLSESAGKLVQTGVITDLGKNEDLQAVRWLDDLAILVTYRQVDPLYTIDLTDQAHPKKLGALKIPGYSGYLHPIGAGRLLGLGRDTDGSGMVDRGQAAVFDITDPQHPRRISKHAFANYSGISAVDDPRSFTWLDESRTAVTTVSDWNTGRSNLVALEVGPAGYLHVRTLTRLNSDWMTRTLPLPGGRVAVLDQHRLRVVAVG